MSRIITFLFLLTACCRAAEPLHTHGLDLSESERLRLEQKATSGDASAAMRLWQYYAIELHDDGPSGDRWLCRAADLGDATAQWNLGYSLKEGYRAGQTFPEYARKWGPTRKTAVKKLLEASSRTVDSACFELASAYEDGYFGTRNRVKAREYFLKGAQLNDESCWEKLADYYRRGMGGPRDEVEAYYWISLYARCLRPDNILGEQAWKTREEIAQHLSPATLESAWQRIDAFIARITASKVTPDSDGKLSDPSPHFLPELQAREDEHRNRLKTR
jgi:TPR repeat protein